ncbi:MAG: hypothetical protein KDC95_05440 [Planctomycetes bacterium]|nr:hypothetical protein [Planctomycetota bacterium]
MRIHAVALDSILLRFEVHDGPPRKKRAGWELIVRTKHDRFDITRIEFYLHDSTHELGSRKRDVVSARRIHGQRRRIDGRDGDMRVAQLARDPKRQRAAVHVRGNEVDLEARLQADGTIR